MLSWRIVGELEGATLSSCASEGEMAEPLDFQSGVCGFESRHSFLMLYGESGITQRFERYVSGSNPDRAIDSLV